MDMYKIGITLVLRTYEEQKDSLIINIERMFFDYFFSPIIPAQYM